MEIVTVTLNEWYYVLSSLATPNSEIAIRTCETDFFRQLLFFLQLSHVVESGQIIQKKLLIRCVLVQWLLVIDYFPS